MQSMDNYKSLYPFSSTYIGVCFIIQSIVTFKKCLELKHRKLWESVSFFYQHGLYYSYKSAKNSNIKTQRTPLIQFIFLSANQIKENWLLTSKNSWSIVKLENPSSGFPTRSDTNWAVQPQEMARGLKFRI